MATIQWIQYGSWHEVVETLGNRETRKVGHNTTLIRRTDTEIALRLHQTDILTFTPAGVTYQTGGWRTVTTKARLNAYGLPKVSIWQQDHEWNVTAWGTEYGDVHVKFYDGMMFDWDGSPVSSLETVAPRPTRLPITRTERVIASNVGGGLSLDEFEKLSAVKARTLGSDVLSAVELERLRFVRWCYQNGKVTS